MSIPKKPASVTLNVVIGLGADVTVENKFCDVFVETLPPQQ